MPDPGESYSAAGVNYERLQEEVLAGEANVKEMTPMPSTAATAATAATADPSSATHGGPAGGRDLRRDDIMYFSID